MEEYPLISVTNNLKKNEQMYQLLWDTDSNIY